MRAHPKVRSHRNLCYGVAPLTTALFDRMKKEGRLIEDGQSISNFGLPNFRTVLPLPILLRGLCTLLTSPRRASCLLWVLPVLPAPGTVMPPASKEVRAYTIQRGMPYSGVRVVQHVTIFPDGHRKEGGSSTKESRDSEGRTRKDVTWTENDSINGVVTVCVIEDPVSLVRYIWKVVTAQKTVVTETHYKMEGQVTEVWPHPPNHTIEPKPGG